MKLINKCLKSINKLPSRLRREEDRRKDERRLKGIKRERENKHDNAQIISLSDKNIAIKDS